MPGWPEPEWSSFPLLVRLREFAAWLAEPGDQVGAGAAADDALMWGFVRHELAERNLSFCLSAH